MSEALKFLELKDCRIKFNTCDGTYEGDLKTVSISCEKMILHNCVFLADNIRVGTLFLSFEDVSDVAFISRSSSNNQFRPLGLGMRRSIQCDKTRVLNIKDFPISPLFDHLPTRVSIISSYGEELKRAINDLNMSKVIGISLEGPMIGRYGIINWLCASSESGTYLFDLQALGRRVFDLGLRRILESKAIEKVIHDCREVSDALFHLFGTKLAKVFDTQTSEAFVNLQINGSKFRGFVNSLDSCLKKYLNITDEYLPQPVEDVPYPQKVKSSQLRPLEHMAMSIMIKKVVYLLSLREELKQKMLCPYRGGVETYLKAVASKSERELRHYPYDPAIIPAELLVEDKFGAVEYKETHHVPLNETFNMPYPEGYEIVNKLNELRKKNPYSSADEIHAKMPRVQYRKKGSLNYVDFGSGLDLEFGYFPSINSNPTSLTSKNATSITGCSAEHPHSSVSVGEKQLPSTSNVPLSCARPLQNSNSKSGSVLSVPSTDENSFGTKAENRKPSRSVDSVGNIELPDGFKRRITDSRVLKMIQLIIHNQKNPASRAPLQVPRSEECDFQKPIASERKQCHKLPSALRCEAKSKTAQESYSDPSYNPSDYNTVCYKDDGTFSYLPKKKDPSYDPDNPWSVFQSEYPEEESFGCNRASRLKLVPAGHE